jgi:cytochrome P450
VTLSQNCWKKKPRQSAADVDNNNDDWEVERGLDGQGSIIGGDITVPKGTYLYFPIWTIQRDERNFPDPLRFCPERWVCRENNATDGCWVPRHNGDPTSSPSSSSTDLLHPPGNRQAFVAFSAGARSCAGEKFARNEMRIALFVLLPRFRFQPPDDYVLDVHRQGIVISPTKPIPMTISMR